MTEERPVQHKLSLASIFRRVAAMFRQGETSPDYQRWERAQGGSEEARLMREEGAGQAMRDMGGGGFGGVL